MSLVVLKQKNQIEKSREILKKVGASAIDTRLKKFFKKLGIGHPIQVGEHVKSWDLLKTVEFINQNVAKDAKILDLGCYASEVVLSLHKLGYTGIHGVDLNENIKNMPHQDTIHYVKSDFMNTPFPPESFDAITSISVIEHGFNGEKLYKEVSRLLKPGGYFIASFDYWPEKIDTSGVKFYDMDWLIFSKDDVMGMVHIANRNNLVPVGPMNFESDEKCIDCANKKYTFAWMALQKKKS
jgi:SAM-dependent methyltransferase